MDNHLAASWCWAQHIAVTDTYNFAHVDAHWDVGANASDDLDIVRQPGFWNKSLADVVAERSRYTPALAGTEMHPGPLFSFDNYIVPFIDTHPGIQRCLLHARQHPGIGGEKSLKNAQLFSGVRFADFAKAFRRCRQSLILNVDIDYAFHPDSDFEDEAGDREQLVTDEFLQCAFKEIAALLSTEAILVFTVALSPYFCGGNARAVRIWNLACAELGIDSPISVIDNNLCLQP